MSDQAPHPPEACPAPAGFAPVPRLRDRHDGWTPERQRAFIAALADCGSVRSAASMVNMSSESAYALRRHPQAAGFRAAWHAAQGMGVLRLKDEAFERAIHGELVPVMSAGKLMGFRRKRNDRLLMFILRHYGATPDDRRHTIRHITAQATAVAITTSPDAASPDAATTQAAAQATITAGTPPAADDDAAHAATLAAFAGVPLDPAAQAEILAALAANAARAHALPPEDDPDVPYLPLDADGHHHALLEGVGDDLPPPYASGEPEWRLLDDPAALDAIEAATRCVADARISGDWDREGEKLSADRARKADRDARLEGGWEGYVED